MANEPVSKCSLCENLYNGSVLMPLILANDKIIENVCPNCGLNVIREITGDPGFVFTSPIALKVQELVLELKKG